MTRSELPVPVTSAGVAPALVAELARRSLDRFANWDELSAVLALALETRLPVILFAFTETRWVFLRPSGPIQ